jgi:osmotically inducible protein OsmC
MKRQATAVWSGALTDGTGDITTQSGALSSQPYSFKTRFQDESGKSGTNPEELLAAAHAGCFAMQLSHMLAEAGTPAARLEAKAVVTVEPKDGGGFQITQSALTLVGKVPGASEADFLATARKAKETCPVSVALGAIELTLTASLDA